MDEADTKEGVLANTLVYLLRVISFLLLWEIAGLNSEVLPTPIETVQKMAHMFTHKVADKLLFAHIGRSLFRMFLGLVIGVVLGIPFGIFMGYNKYFEAFLKYPFEAFRMIPALAWIPLSILFFGISEFGKIFIIIIASVSSK